LPPARFVRTGVLSRLELHGEDDNIYLGRDGQAGKKFKARHFRRGMLLVHSV